MTNSSSSNNSTTLKRNIMIRDKITGLKCMGTSRVTPVSPIASKDTTNSIVRTANMITDSMGRTLIRVTPTGTRMNTSTPTLTMIMIQAWDISSTVMRWRVDINRAMIGTGTPATITAEVATITE